VTTQLEPMLITCGLAAFVANAAMWNAPPADVQALLRRELPRLEHAIWAEAARETGEGMACNIGTHSCTSGRTGCTVLVGAPEVEEHRLLVKHILPAWLRRSGTECLEAWRKTIGPATGIEA
jgi:hypothetical protein